MQRMDTFCCVLFKIRVSGRGERAAEEADHVEWYHLFQTYQMI